MKRELRQQIKQDEFASGLEKAFAWAQGHRDEVRIAVGLAVVLAAAFGALGYFQGQRAREAERAYHEAMAAFEAPVAAELPAGADRPSGQVFATGEEKYKTAAAAFEGVARRYGSLDPGIRAQYYAALCRIELGQYAEAEKSLRDLQGQRRRDLVPELARLALAGLYRRSGQTDKAVEVYRSVVSEPATTLARDHALWALAGALEDSRRFAEARAAYRELLQEFPTSIYADEARSRVEFLDITERG